MTKYNAWEGSNAGIIPSNLLQSFNASIAWLSLTEEYFTQHKNPLISQVAVDIISNQHFISDKWEKHGIYTETEEMQLKKAVDTAIYSLKIAKISEHIEAKNIELSEGDNDDINLLVEINNMLKIKREISEKLGRIVLKWEVFPYIFNSQLKIRSAIPLI